MSQERQQSVDIGTFKRHHDRDRSETRSQSRKVIRIAQNVESASFDDKVNTTDETKLIQEILLEPSNVAGQSFSNTSMDGYFPSTSDFDQSTIMTPQGNLFQHSHSAINIALSSLFTNNISKEAEERSNTDTDDEISNSSSLKNLNEIDSNEGYPDIDEKAKYVKGGCVFDARKTVMLMEEFKKNPNPSTKKCQEIAEKFNENGGSISGKQVRSWFVTRRKGPDAARENKLRWRAAHTELDENTFNKMNTIFEDDFNKEPFADVQKLKELAKPHNYSYKTVMQWFMQKRVRVVNENKPEDAELLLKMRLMQQAMEFVSFMDPEVFMECFKVFKTQKELLTRDAHPIDLRERKEETRRIQEQMTTEQKMMEEKGKPQVKTLGELLNEQLVQEQMEQGPNFTVKKEPEWQDVFGMGKEIKVEVEEETQAVHELKAREEQEPGNCDIGGIEYPYRHMRSNSHPRLEFGCIFRDGLHYVFHSIEIGPIGEGEVMSHLKLFSENREAETQDMYSRIMHNKAMYARMAEDYENQRSNIGRMADGAVQKNGENHGNEVVQRQAERVNFIGEKSIEVAHEEVLNPDGDEIPNTMMVTRKLGERS